MIISREKCQMKNFNNKISLSRMISVTHLLFVVPMKEFSHDHVENSCKSIVHVFYVIECVRFEYQICIHIVSKFVIFLVSIRVIVFQFLSTEFCFTEKTRRNTSLSLNMRHHIVKISYLLTVTMKTSSSTKENCQLDYIIICTRVVHKE